MRAGGGDVHVARNPAAATPAAVAAAIVVHGIRQSVRWQRGAGPPSSQVGRAALCRVFTLAFSWLGAVGKGVLGRRQVRLVRAAAWRRFAGFLQWHSPGLVRWVKGRWAAAQSGGAGGGLAALCRILGIAFSLAYCSIGVGIGWVAGYRFCQSLRLDVSPHGRGVLRKSLARYG